MTNNGFARKLQTRRNTLGLNTNETAKLLAKAGIKTTRRTIEEWEQGRRVPQGFKQAAILKILQGVPATAVWPRAEIFPSDSRINPQKRV